MLTRNPYTENYAHAFALRSRMQAFLVDFGEKRGWARLARLVEIRFDGTFLRFLDAPTSANLSKVLDFDDEMVRVGASMKGDMIRRS